MSDTTTTATQGKAAIRSGLAATQQAYRDLIAQVDDAHWKTQSGNPSWTCGQLAWHLANGINFNIGLIKNARKGKATNPPGFLLPLAFKANEFLVRRNSRRATRESVLADSDAAFPKLLALLDDVRDDEMATSATNFGRTRTIAETFRVVVEHFEEHGPEIRFGLAR